MRKITQLPLIALLLVIPVFALASILFVGSHSPVVVYSAPTLVGLAEEAAARHVPGQVDVRSIGSVMGVRLIQAGRVPDAFLSVDWELLRFINPRRVVDLGSFKLLLVCRSGSLEDVGRVKLGLANPNVAPIGYRAIAALFWLSTRYNLTDLGELGRDLSIDFKHTLPSGELIIDVREFRASGRFVARDDLAGVGALLEGGAVDCIFAHSPFVVTRRYEERFKVFELPPEIQFIVDPPINFKAITESGEIDVKAFRAFAASFTEKGDDFLDTLQGVELARHGLMMRHG